MTHTKAALLIGVWMLCMIGFSSVVSGNQDPQKVSAIASQEFAPHAPEIFPKVGVVLSGGGARGFAHIGALKVLEEVGIPIDYVVGTSMGSIVGGLYAIGYSAHEIEAMVTEVDWEELFTDTPPRKLWSYQKKRASAKYILGVEFTRKGFVVPQGLTAGQKISNLMAFLTLRASDIDDFDEFPIPYRAVAADIVSGEEVILDQGSLADAMRASMAVPGIFTPITVNKHLLVDGGVVKNLPVDVAQQMGADIVIAIDVSSPLKGSEELGNPLSILNQMIALQILKATQEQRELADIVILADLGEYSSTDFGSGPEIIALGEQSARASLEELQQLAGRINATGPRNRILVSSVVQDVKDIYVKDIVIEGSTIVDERLLLRQLQEQKGKPLNPELLEQKITEIFSTGNYETVKFTLVPATGDGKILKLQLDERKQGMHFLRFGMNYASRFDDAEEDKMIFLLNATLNNLTGPGSSWSTDLQFVNVTKVDTEYVQPLVKGVYLAHRAYRFEDFQPIYENKQSIGRYDKDEWGIDIRLGTFLRRFGDISVGYWFENVDITPTVGEEQTLPRFAKIVGSLTLRSHLDLLDTFPFPTSGRMLHLDYQMATPELGSEVEFHRLAAKYWRYYAAGPRHTVGLRFHLGTDFKTEMPCYKHFTFGGRDSFAGYKVDEFTGSHLGIITLEYRYRLHQLPSAVGGGIFAIAKANVGNVWETANEISEKFSLRYGGSLGVGVDTVLGPVFADFAMGDGGRQAIYLNIGYTF